MTQDIPTVEEKFIEAGATLEHARWSRWQEYMHSKFVEHENGKGEWVCLPADLVRRWERQIGTEYASLSEEEKESDRKEVREYLPLLRAYGTARYEEGVKAERERCKRCYEANTRHNPHSLSEPYSPNYKNANTATTHISYLDYTDFVPKPRFTTDKPLLDATCR